MGRTSRIARTAAGCCASAALLVGAGVAAAEQPPAAPLQPLPPAPELLERVMRGFLESVPDHETLDDILKRATVRNRAAVEEAQRRQFIRQQAQQFEQMLQPLLAAELAFVRRACGSLAPDDRRAVLAAARQAVQGISEKIARQQLEGLGDAAGGVEVRQSLHDLVAAAVAARAAPEEFAAYQRESRLRLERRAEAARVRIVSKLDEQLGLSAAQRRDVLDDLRAHWSGAWIRELEDHDGVMINGRPPAPDFADASIAPHLDATQLRCWREWSQAAGWDAIPRGGVDWSDLNALQQGQLKIDSWWRP